MAAWYQAGMSWIWAKALSFPLLPPQDLQGVAVEELRRDRPQHKGLLPLFQHFAPDEPHIAQGLFFPVEKGGDAPDDGRQGHQPDLDLRRHAQCAVCPDEQVDQVHVVGSIVARCVFGVGHLVGGQGDLDEPAAVGAQRPLAPFGEVFPRRMVSVSPSASTIFSRLT